MEEFFIGNTTRTASPGAERQEAPLSYVPLIKFQTKAVLSIESECFKQNIMILDLRLTM
jgi:hypothetical protein